MSKEPLSQKAAHQPTVTIIVLRNKQPRLVEELVSFKCSNFFLRTQGQRA